MFTKRHYHAMAGVFREVKPKVGNTPVGEPRPEDMVARKQWEFTIRSFIVMLHLDNHHFDKHWFLEACGVEDAR